MASAFQRSPEFSNLQKDDRLSAETAAAANILFGFHPLNPDPRINPGIFLIRLVENPLTRNHQKQISRLKRIRFTASLINPLTGMNIVEHIGVADSRSVAVGWLASFVTWSMDHQINGLVKVIGENKALHNDHLFYAPRSGNLPSSSLSRIPSESQNKNTLIQLESME